MRAKENEMPDPAVYVILKDGNSYGTRDGTPLCVDLDERTARMTKIGRCVRYVPDSVMRGVEQGMTAERSAIVEWLRAFAVLRGGALTADEDAAHEALLMVVADAIERGDHVSSGTTK